MNQQELDAARDALAAEQGRVAHVAGGLAPEGWSVHLLAADVAKLRATGHLQQYQAELEWTPHQVIGHLRDSAEIFTHRIVAVKSGAEPMLADFVTDDPVRLADYASRSSTELLAELAVAQQYLRDALADVAPSQLACRGKHEVDGELTLADLVAFLPGHQRDHADQLVLLASTAGVQVDREPAG